MDTVYHLAAVTDRQMFVENACEAYDVNVCGTLAVLHYCRKVGATCVMTSTSGVYNGSSESENLSESDEINPSNPYSLSKWLAEEVCKYESENMGVRTIILRLFNVFGYGQDSSFLIPYIVNCLIAGEKMNLRMPEATRDFVYIDDVVEALLKAGQIRDTYFDVFNIGSGNRNKGY